MDRTTFTVLCAAWLLVAGATPAYALVGEVTSHQKISATDGNFPLGLLDDGDLFGQCGCGAFVFESAAVGVAGERRSPYL